MQPLYAVILGLIALLSVRAEAALAVNEEQIESMRRKLDGVQFRAELQRIAEDKDAEIDLRRAAVEAVSRLNSSEDCWPKEYPHYRAKLSATDTPKELRPLYAEGLARAMRQRSTCLKSLAAELKTLSPDLPPEGADALQSVIASLEREYRPLVRPGVFQPPPAVEGLIAPTAEMRQYLKVVASELNTTLIHAARSKERDGDWEAARAGYVQAFGATDKKEETLELIMRTFVNERKLAALNAQTAKAFEAFVQERLNSPEALDSALVLIAQTHFRENQLDLALTAAKDAAARSVGARIKMQARLQEALVYSRSDKSAQALEIFAELSAQKDVDAELAQRACFLKGWVFVFGQEDAKAKEALESSIRNYPNSEYTDKAKELLTRLSGKKKE